MYTQSTLYYLNQLGIRPWVPRVPLLPLAKLLIVISTELNNRASLLLERMMSSIDIDKDRYSLFYVGGKSFQHDFQHAMKQIANQSELLCLVLGSVDLGAMKLKLNQSTIIESLDLNYVVENPLKKKRVYNDLLSLKQLLHSIE